MVRMLRTLPDRLLGGVGKIVQMCENIENEIGYNAPTYEKPFKAYQETQKWGDEWESVPEKWKQKMLEIFGGYIVS
ncbi:MAG: hypothetical protein ACXV8O_04235 [Methylobacter sp.]